MNVATCSYVVGLNGVNKIRFEGVTSAKEHIGVNVDPEDIIELANVLQKIGINNEGEYHTGHAVYHFNNPDIQYSECPSCNLLRERYNELSTSECAR